MRYSKARKVLTMCETGWLNRAVALLSFRTVFPMVVQVLRSLPPQGFHPEGETQRRHSSSSGVYQGRYLQLKYTVGIPEIQLAWTEAAWVIMTFLLFAPASKRYFGKSPKGPLRLILWNLMYTYFDTLLRYVLSVALCGAAVLKVMDQKTLVKGRWSYKVLITVYI